MSFDPDVDEVTGIATMLGGDKVLGRCIETWVEAHDAIEAGLPFEARTHFLSHFASSEILPEVESAIGSTADSGRDLSAGKNLSSDQGSTLWAMASVLLHASDAFGSTEVALLWLGEPAMALSNRKPIELISSPAGQKAINTCLIQMKYCVYV